MHETNHNVFVQISLVLIALCLGIMLTALGMVATNLRKLLKLRKKIKGVMETSVKESEEREKTKVTAGDSERVTLAGVNVEMSARALTALSD